MQINYYYNDECSCCKGYKEIVEKICDEFKIDASHINISENKIKDEWLKGVPAVRLYNDQGKMIMNSVGNLPYEFLKQMVKEAIYGKTK